MAHVSFANARIESMMSTNIQNANISLNNGLGLWWYSSSFSYGRVTTNSACQVILDTPSRKSFLFTGSFTTDGDTSTEIFLMVNNVRYWKFTNITFHNGDDYSFIIDVDINPA